jgi:hypothetical protein
VTAEPSAIAPTPRLRCRAIVENDLDGLAGLLVKGFPRTEPAYWTRGFSRWKYLPAVEGLPRYGYVLDTGTGPVGVILLLSSQRGDEIVANLSSWYVEPEWRTHSTLLIAVATKLKHVTYTNVSPAPHTWRTLEAQSFIPYNFGRSAIFALPGRGTVSQAIPDDLPEAQLLRDHRALGQISLVVEKDGVVSPIVLRPRRLDKPPVPVMDVMYCRSPEDFARCAPALARHFLPRSLGFLIDGDVPSSNFGPSSNFKIWGHYVEGKERRYYKGPWRPRLGDLAYTEKAIFE